MHRLKLGDAMTKTVVNRMALLTICLVQIQPLLSTTLKVVGQFALTNLIANHLKQSSLDFGAAFVLILVGCYTYLNS